MKAFYFSAENKKLRYGDNREIALGETHTVNCKPKCCYKGLHASLKVFDALKYAPSNHLYLVELGGKMDHNDDKVAAQSRKYLDYFDVEDLLREFARKQALVNIEKIKPYCSTEDYNLILEYLNTGNANLRKAAEAAAESAAESAWSAAESAESAAESAWSAAESAAWSAWSAARSAAESAADSAARSAAESAARLAAESAAESAARLAAESAARLAAESAARETLQEMILKATGWEL